MRLGDETEPRQLEPVTQKPLGVAREDSRAFLRERLLRLGVLTQNIASAPDLSRLMETILTEVLDFTGFERGLLLLAELAQPLLFRLSLFPDPPLLRLSPPPLVGILCGPMLANSWSISSFWATFCFRAFW